MTRAGAFAIGLVLFAGAFAHAQDVPPAGPPPGERPTFEAWLAALRVDALARGIRAEVFDTALAGVQPLEQVLERDRTQAEFTLELDDYLKRRLTPTTVRTAQRLYTQHRSLLQRIGKRYEIDPRILVAIWGLESNFGRFSGVRPTIPTLATLAYDPRRSVMFRNELLNALEIVNRGDIELERLKGSWAGALGQPQFMPSSYLKYAQDFDEDGRRDIWASLPDVFASIAFFLKEHGWTGGRLWGREVTASAAARREAVALPRREIGCRALRVMTPPEPLDAWSQRGFRTTAGRPLPRSDVEASLVPAGTRSFLVYPNYEALLGYNCAHSYALSVALLADRLK